MPELMSFLEDWRPAPQEMSRTVTADPIDRFSALLTTPPPALSDGDPVPPLWHLFFFADIVAQSELGADGHPREGVFLPPIPDRKRMFAGGRFEQTAPFRIGSPYTRTSSVAGTQEKVGRSGPSLFVTVRHEYLHGPELIATEEEDIVYRSQAPGVSRAPTSTGKENVEARVDPQRTEVDEPFLFRFSALTNNAHRIHYDHPYATGVEGFPGLVVQGPLLALLALEAPRRILRPSLLSSYSFRLTRPAFLGQDIEATASRTDDEWHLEAGSAGQPSSVKATAVFREI